MVRSLLIKLGILSFALVVFAPTGAHAAAPSITFTSPAAGSSHSSNKFTLQATLQLNGNTDYLNKDIAVFPAGGNGTWASMENYDDSAAYVNPTSNTQALTFIDLPLIHPGTNYFDFYVATTDGEFGEYIGGFEDPTEFTINYTGNLFPVYRFWSSPFNNAHFFTMNYDEKENILFNDYNWDYEGIGYTAVRPSDGFGGSNCGAKAQVYRFWSSRFKSHFYTSSISERDNLISGDTNWQYEGTTYCADNSAVANTTPLYRFWSSRFGKHFFTSNLTEKNIIVSSDPNWTYEGIAYHVQQ